MSNDIGFLYVISDGSKVKIGKSKSPKQRTSNIIRMAGIKNPKVFISKECSAASNKERLCHKYYSRLNVCGEWFSVPFNDAVDSVSMVVGSEDLSVKKNEDKAESQLCSDRIVESIKAFSPKRNCSNDNFDDLFLDTIELINICEDDSLIDRAMVINGSLELLLILRCEALMDVIKQQKKLLDFTGEK